MFCPRIKGKCRTDCVKWVPELGKCLEVVVAEFTLRANQVVDYLIQIQRIAWKLEIKRLINDPTIPSELREAIQEAKDATTVEKLLGDAGLLD